MVFSSHTIRIALSALQVALLFTLLTVSQGCQPEEISSSTTPIARQKMPYDPRVPLTESDIETFLKVIEVLPNRKVPEFASPQIESSQTKLTATQLIEFSRSEIRERFDAATQSESWEKNPRLKSAFAHVEVDPAQFAVLATRLSLAYTGHALNGKIEFDKTHSQAQKILAATSAEMNRLDTVPTAQRSLGWQQKRSRLADRLKQAVAMETFCSLLQEIPEQSRHAIAKYQDQLVPLLSNPKQAEALFQQQFSITAKPTNRKTSIQPASYEKPK